MKRIIIAILALIVVVTTTACGSKTNDTSSNTGNKPVDTKKIPEVITEEYLRNYPTTSEKDFEVKEVTGGVEITAYTGESPVVVIPNTIDGKTVVSIAKFTVFANSSTVRAVLVPETVKELDHTFVNNKYIEIIIAEGVERCLDYAVANCPKLHTLIFGDSLKEIGESGISVDEMLTEVYISPNVTQIDPAVAWSVFYSCSNLTIVGESGSYIESFAQEKGINFRSVK